MEAFDEFNDETVSENLFDSAIDCLPNTVDDLFGFESLLEKSSSSDSIGTSILLNLLHNLRNINCSKADGTKIIDDLSKRLKKLMLRFIDC
mgnify:CR=1 FL=1